MIYKRCIEHIKPGDVIILYGGSTIECRYVVTKKYSPSCFLPLRLRLSDQNEMFISFSKINMKSITKIIKAK